jgi:esterase/lipase superfamily enzyme
MKKLCLYYATNRGHLGDRWKPDSYGTKFSADGTENLRFGKLNLEADEKQLTKHLGKTVAGAKGNGEGLSGYLGKQMKRAKIRAFRENAKSGDPAAAVYGSKAMFDELQGIMKKATDVVIYIHGFNVDWNDAVASALALQEMLNLEVEGVPKQKTQVVLFTWPSNGRATPWASYRSDREEAAASGKSVGRGMLKLRDFLVQLRDCDAPDRRCNQKMHLLCHSMGNFVLQNAVARLRDFTPGSALPRMFEHIFLCAPDVDDNILEPPNAMGDLHELGRCVTIYHNRGDLALHGSDYTKGNPDRLGTNGPARSGMVHNKVHSVDCSAIVKGFMEHSYYLGGLPNQDIRASIADVVLAASVRERKRNPDVPNLWEFPKA